MKHVLSLKNQSLQGNERFCAKRWTNLEKHEACHSFQFDFKMGIFSHIALWFVGNFLSDFKMSILLAKKL